MAELGQRLGLFGGTFNPIHNGHLKVALVVKEFFKLNKILFIPSYLPPHKSTREIASPEDRLKMVELALAPFPQFEASSLEVDRPETSYSIVTLQKVKQIYEGAQIFFIVGIDAFLEIKTWREYEKVLSACSFIVVSRPGFSLDQAMMVLGPEWKERIVWVDSHDQVKEKEPRIYLFPMQSLNISASEIRMRRLRGEAITGLVPVAVEKYILEKNLYLCDG
ncbi:MAG: nicotinate-nucleotide adenylyltransferase [Candidatus Aminicenantes bacterium]|nr:nicotinate-nucleotide adenylyltransferase [Candidatus Aminicenantes bacterium]